MTFWKVLWPSFMVIDITLVDDIFLSSSLDKIRKWGLMVFCDIHYFACLFLIVVCRFFRDRLFSCRGGVDYCSVRVCFFISFCSRFYYFLFLGERKLILLFFKNLWRQMNRMLIFIDLSYFKKTYFIFYV